MRKDTSRIQVAAIIAATALYGQAPAAPERREAGPKVDSCPSAIVMPGYPPLAWSGRITGHGTAAVDLDSTGILDIRTANLHPLLASEVVKSIRSSQFADCGPRQLALEYDFVMEGKEAISTAITVIVLSGSHFMIKVNPPKAME